MPAKKKKGKKKKKKKNSIVKSKGHHTKKLSSNVKILSLYDSMCVSPTKKKNVEKKLNERPTSPSSSSCHEVIKWCDVELYDDHLVVPGKNELKPPPDLSKLPPLVRPILVNDDKTNITTHIPTVLFQSRCEIRRTHESLTMSQD